MPTEAKPAVTGPPAKPVPPTPPQDFKSFINFFKGYMGVMPLVVAAFAPVVTLLNAIPTYALQTKVLSTMSGLLGFLLVAWAFSSRHTLAIRFFYNDVDRKLPANAPVRLRFSLFRSAFGAHFWLIFFTIVFFLATLAWPSSITLTLIWRKMIDICMLFSCYFSDIVFTLSKRIFIMATAVALPRPDLAAHREALTLPWQELVKRLTDMVGRKLTAYIAGVKDVRALDRWIAGVEPYGDVEARLRFAYQVARTLNEHDSPRVVQAWLTGVNPELGDRVPLRLLKEGDLDEIAPKVLGAARAFIAGA